MADDDYSEDSGADRSSVALQRDRVSHKRIKGLILEKAVVYGSMAWLLPEKNAAGHTHAWVVYVRSATNEDMSYFVKKVIITLHSSFETPRRVLEMPPYEVQETGWGEFEIHFKILFHETSEKPVDLYHPLKLRNADGSNGTVDKPLVSEWYDELVFTDPTEAFTKRLQLTGDPAPQNPLSKFYTEFSEHNELKKIFAAHKRVKTEIQQIQAKLDQAETDLKHTRKTSTSASNSQLQTPSVSFSTLPASTPIMPQ